MIIFPANLPLRLTASFSASTPLTHQVPDQSLMPSLIPKTLSLASSNNSSSDSSLNFEDQFERQVVGAEMTTPTLDKKIPQLEDYPVDSYRSARMRSDSVNPI